MIPTKFSGHIVRRPTNYSQVVGPDCTLDEYTVKAYQYSSSSKPNFCAPSAIYFANNEEDVKLVIKYAKKVNVGVSVRSGGHQFWGFSSTSGSNIQLDMSSFNGFNYCPTTNRAELGTGLLIKDLDDKFANLGLFVPHGQCGTVAVGGHLQTGGISPFCGRSHGFFADHVVEFKIVTADLVTRVVTRPPGPKIRAGSDNDVLWYGVMGGSPGNFGVVISLTIVPLRDCDYPFSRAYTFVTANPKAYEEVTRIATEFNDDEGLAADWNVVAFTMAHSEPYLRANIETKMQVAHPEVYGDTTPVNPLNLIGLWIVYTNLDGQFPSNEVFAKFKAIKRRLRKYRPSALFDAMMAVSKGLSKYPFPMFDYADSYPMSFMNKRFVFPARVHATPYVAFNVISDKHDLSRNGYVEWAVEGFNKVRKHPSAYADFEHVVMGGRYSKNRTGGYSYPNSHSWRGSLSMFAFQYVKYDCTNWLANTTCLPLSLRHLAYQQEPKEFALGWVEWARRTAVGEKGVACEREMCWKAFPNQDENLDLVREKYFENQEQWERVLAVKERFDPSDVFTANYFCIGAGAKGKVRF